MALCSVVAEVAVGLAVPVTALTESKPRKSISRLAIALTPFDASGLSTLRPMRELRSDQVKRPFSPASLLTFWIPPAPCTSLYDWVES